MKRSLHNGSPKVPALRSLGEVGLDELNEVLAA